MRYFKLFGVGVRGLKCLYSLEKKKILMRRPNKKKKEINRLHIPLTGVEPLP